MGQALFGTPKGRSRTLGFLLGPEPLADPEYLANSGPIISWIWALQQPWVPERIMRSCFEAFMNLENASWQKVQGPAGAVYCTLKRLRWGIVSWDPWVTDDGIRINPG
eukprot:2792306-Pyramimonas_sp.AAC.1